MNAKQSSITDKTNRFIYPNEAEINHSFQWKQLHRLYSYLKPYRKQLLPIVLTLLLSTIIKLIVPALTIIAIDYALNPLSGKPNAGLLIGLAGVNLLLYVLQWAASRYRVLYTNKFGQRIIADMRQQLFRHIQSLSHRFFNSRPVGAVLGRITNDVNALEELFTNGIVNLFMDMIQLIGIMIILLAWNVKLGIAVMLTVPLMFFISSVLRRQIRLAFQKLRMKQTRINAHLNESIQGIRVTKAYAQEQHNMRFFDRINEDNVKTWNKAAALNQSFSPIVELTSAIGTVILFLYGTYLIQSGEVTVGVIVGFASYVGNFWEPVMRLGQIYTQLLVGIASSERIFEVLDEQPSTAEQSGMTQLPVINGDVKFRKVAFNYEEGRAALRGIDLEVQAGSTIALVGHTGAGKSTLMNLLYRFYEPTEGSIFIDGTDIRDATIHSLRSQMSMVLQDMFLFSGTIRENIRYGKIDATDEEVERAARAVWAHSFIIKLPNGYDTQIEERGSKLSVGQRQLLSFARALIADPRILILDEATANVDTETEMKIRQALRTVRQGRTTFVVAHRLSTIRDADMIAVVDHGVIVEKGKHDDLINRQGTYYRFVDAQQQTLSIE